MMEVLLLEDITGIGKKNDLLVVREGYALNCLLPHRRAIIATPTVRRRYAEQIRKRAVEKQTEMMMKKDAAASLAGIEVSFERKATKTGKLYAAITEKNIVEALKAQSKMEIPEESITIADPIKALGNFQVTVKLADQDQSLKIVVKAE